MRPSWLAVQLVERGWLPDPVIRAGIRRVVASRLREEQRHGGDAPEAIARFARARSEGPIAMETRAANEQHYEVPTDFYRLVLGRHLKYSSGFWDPGTTSLDVAEARMLALTAERADLQNGQRVLELGCGWGSLSLWMARAFPECRIIGVSNSRTQKIWIDDCARRDGLHNLDIITADMNHFEALGRFDRIVSVEMFEHMRNWRALFGKVARWLEPDGRVFIHIFTHRRYTYPYDARDASDWMARHFFTGGIMPSDDLIYQFQDELQVLDHWRVDGTHYEKTANAWLDNLDRHRPDVWPMLQSTYGSQDAYRWLVRWRVFFMACAELWGWRQGQEWLISHYRLARR